MSEKVKNYTTDKLVQECIKDGVPLDEILLVDCPYCGFETYYSGGFTSICSWCGEDCASASDDARSVEDVIVAAAFDEYGHPHARTFLDDEFTDEAISRVTPDLFKNSKPVGWTGDVAGIGCDPDVP